MVEDTPQVSLDDLVSAEARGRIDDALFTGMAIRKSAIARIGARCKAASGADAVFLEFMRTDPEAAADWSASQIEAAFAYLSAVKKELIDAGKRGRELRSIMDQETEHTIYSLEIRDLEADVIKTRLEAIRSPLTSHAAKSLGKRAGRPSGSPVNGALLRSHRAEYSQEDFAGKCGVSVDSIQRGESDGPLDGRILDAIAQTITLLRGTPVTAQDLKLPQKPQK